MMKECFPKISASGFILQKKTNEILYAERTPYGLMVKTYCNKKQIDNKVIKLREAGFNIKRSLRYPYVIIKIINNI